MKPLVTIGDRTFRGKELEQLELLFMQFARRVWKRALQLAEGLAGDVPGPPAIRFKFRPLAKVWGYAAWSKEMPRITIGNTFNEPEEISITIMHELAHHAAIIVGELWHKNLRGHAEIWKAIFAQLFTEFTPHAPGFLLTHQELQALRIRPDKRLRK